MSTNVNCEIVEPLPGTWYYILEDTFAPKNAWDWRDYATATGPFPTEQAATEYLSENESNPGGWFVTPNADFKMDESYGRLLGIENAKRPVRRYR